MSEIRCFWMEPTGRVHLRLRRFTFGGEVGARTNKHDCPSGRSWGCGAMTEFGRDWPERVLADGCLESYDDVGPGHDDPRWPQACSACGQPFPKFAEWQVFQDIIYRAADGREFSIEESPPGAMWDARWWPDKGPDGLSIAVKLPPGKAWDVWIVDGPSKSGGSWSRTGAPPNITATPSIATSDYHGWLRNGALVPA